MKVRIVQKGGFAGTSVPLADFDTAQLRQHDAERVYDAMRKSDFFRLPVRVERSEIGADMLEFEMTVTDDGRSHTVTFSAGDGLPEPIGTVLELAQPH